MSIPYNLTCITNSYKGVTECETYPLWDFPEVTQGKVKRDWDCYQRLKLFDPKTASVFGDRIMSVDLDVFIDDDLAPLINDELDFQAVEGTASHINGSMYTLKVGTNQHVWDSFDPETSAKVIEKRRITGSDQGWMSIQMPQAPVWTQEDGVWHWKQLVHQREKPKIRLVAFAGKVKPWSDECKLKSPDIYNAYMQYL